VSSRQEEKEQRKRERLERAAAEQKAAKRKRGLQIVGGVIVGAAVVVGVVLAALGGGDGKRDTADLKDAAKTAGCTVRAFPNEGETHTNGKRKLTIADFKTNPPTSGEHDPEPAPDGVYAPGTEPEIENWVHTLEHGRILIQYKAGTSAAQIAQLQKLFNEPVLESGNGYHSVLMQNNTKMPFAVAAVAWRNYVGCPTIGDASIEALRAFRETNVDQAPEQVP